MPVLVLEVVPEKYPPNSLRNIMYNSYSYQSGRLEELWITAFFSRDPIQLEAKTMRHLLGAAMENPGWHLLKQDRPGISIFHQVADRGMTRSFRDVLSGWASGQTDEDIKTWHTQCGCGAHDAHNSVKWASACLFDDEVLLRNCYVGFATFRKGFYHAVSHLSGWLAEVLEQKSPSLLEPSDHLSQLYKSFAVNPDAVVVLAEQAQVSWNFSTNWLQVKASFLQKSSCLEELSFALLEVWRIPSFSCTRWCSLGSSCRNITACFLTGYQAFWEYLVKKGVLSDYESAGATKIGKQEKTLALVLGLASTVADAVLHTILADSRLARQTSQLVTLVHDQLQFLENLPAEFWLHCSAFLDTEASNIRDQVIRGAMLSHAYMSNKIFSILHSLPWALCDGDLSENLKALSLEKEAPSETVTCKIHTLCQMGFPSDQLLRALDLLSQCSFSSSLTEKQHASTSVIRKFRPDLGHNVLMARAWAHTCRLGTGSTLKILSP